MKKLATSLLILLGFTSLSFGQEHHRFDYSEILVGEKLLSDKIRVTIDFGNAKHLTDRNIKDDDGNPVVFNSAVDALNFMGKNGWEFVQAYTITFSSYNVVHYLMKRPVDALDMEIRDE